MENNFFVGDVFHRRKIKFSFIEKLVLYSVDSYNFLDLINDKWYTINNTEKDYVIKDSLTPADISDYKTDYLYLLNKNKIKSKTKSHN